MVTMCELPIRPVQEAIIEKVGSIKPGVYLTVDQILRSFCKKIFRGHVDDKFPLSWKLDAPSEALKLYYEGSEEEFFWKPYAKTCGTFWALKHSLTVLT